METQRPRLLWRWWCGADSGGLKDRPGWGARHRPGACVPVSKHWRFTGVPAWPGRGQAWDGQDDGEDIGQEDYEDEDEEDEEDEEAGRMAGSRDRGTCPSTPRACTSLSALLVGAPELQASVGWSDVDRQANKGFL